MPSSQQNDFSVIAVFHIPEFHIVFEIKSLSGPRDHHDLIIPKPRTESFAGQSPPMYLISEV